MEVGSAHDVNNVCKSDICCCCVGGILKQFQNEEGEESEPRRNRKDQICSRRNPENKSQCCACNTAARDSIQGHHGPIVSFPCVVVAFFIAFAFLLIAFSQEFSQESRRRLPPHKLFETDNALRIGCDAKVVPKKSWTLVRRRWQQTYNKGFCCRLCVSVGATAIHPRRGNERILQWSKVRRQCPRRQAGK